MPPTPRALGDPDLLEAAEVADAEIAEVHAAGAEAAERREADHLVASGESEIFHALQAG